MAAGEKTEGLIIGANGLVGRRIGMLLSNRGIEWRGTYNKRPEGELLKLNITNSAEIEGIFSKFLPEVVFHCANLAGGVDFCEANPDIATEFHLSATKDIGTHCKDIDATMVFISTDYIFDGSKEFYTEKDSPNPLNLYGRLKLQAEQWIQKNLKKYLIIRTANIYGWDPQTITPNYIMNLYNTLKDKKSFNAPSFLWGTPTYVGDLAGAIVELVDNKTKGIFHIVGSSFVHRFQWVKEACKILGLDFSLVNEISTPSANMVPRPLKSRLDTEKFTKLYKTILNDLSTGLGLMESEMSH